MNIFLGIMIPFAGTALGAACVFLLKNDIRAGVQKALLGFASGIMVAASVWSLLIPAMEMSESMGKLRFIPAALGFMVGILTLLLMDSYVPHQHLGQEEAEGVKKNWSRNIDVYKRQHNRVRNILLLAYEISCILCSFPLWDDEFISIILSHLAAKMQSTR